MPLSEFHFLRPYWLLTLIPLCLIVWLLITQRLGNRNWNAVCDSELLPHILIGNPGKTHRYVTLLVGLCGLLAIMALSGPTWERLPQPVFRSDSALVIALDLSRSMDATDIKPNRLERARYKIADLLRLRGDGQTALIVYAGDAFVVSPLTDDVKTISSQLSALTTSLMPVQGSDTDLALTQAVSLLKQAGNAKGHILLVTDGVDENRFKEEFRGTRQQGYTVSILGVGTEEGAPVRLPDGGFLKDKNGTIVIPVTDHAMLNKMAHSGGGRYVSIQPDDSDIESLNLFFNRRLSQEGKAQSELKTDIWRDQGPWLLLFTLPFAAFAFRKGYIILLLIFILPLPEQANAFEWNDLWLNKNQKALKQFNSGDAEGAASQFNDPAWKAAAKYRAGDYEAVPELLKDMASEDSFYNSANALAKQGKYKDALAAYDKILNLNPNHEDAKHNRELVEEALKKQQQEQQQNQRSQQDDSDDNESKQDQADQQSGQEQQSQQENPAQEAQQSESSGSKQQQTDKNVSEQQQDKQGQAEQEQNEQMQSGNEEQSEEDQEGEEAESMAMDQEQTQDEESQATEQWLRRIPDDPAGLLRRKFRYQYQQRTRQHRSTDQDW